MDYVELLNTGTTWTHSERRTTLLIFVFADFQYKVIFKGFSIIVLDLQVFPSSQFHQHLVYLA